MSTPDYKQFTSNLCGKEFSVAQEFHLEGGACQHCGMTFSQILKLIPRHEFEALAKQHHSGRSFRTASDGHSS